jgi:ATPase family associated with various cellular activities (AAA)
MNTPSGLNLFSIVGTLTLLGTSLLSLWALFKYLLTSSYRVNDDVSKRLIRRIISETRVRFVITSESEKAHQIPDIYEAFTILDRVPFFIFRGERMLTAGWKHKEVYSMVYFLRWHRSRIDAILKSRLVSDGEIPISALLPGGPERLGELKNESDPQIFLNRGTYEDIESDVVRVINGELPKTSCLLYGPPGNGKSQFVKYISRKYSLPIFLIYLNPEYDNFDISKMFSHIPRRSIVLFEDFDNYFDGRDCLIPNDKIRFTFDSILNNLDGVHNDYRETVFMMTANEIDKIDIALKQRPSRFKFVREFQNPGEQVRRRILGDDQALLDKSEGMSLDSVFALLDSTRLNS